MTRDEFIELYWPEINAGGVVTQDQIQKMNKLLQERGFDPLSLSPGQEYEE
jgi:hypothetical protein